MKHYSKRYVISLPFVMAIALTSCFTGVESTKKITSKDVEKTLGAVSERAESSLEVTMPDTFPNWKDGKSFYVTDVNVKKIFRESKAYDLDTIFKKGELLRFKGEYNEHYLDNKEKVNLVLTDGDHDFVYPTGKTLAELSNIKGGLKIPFLVDMDMVRAYSEAMSGKKYYIRTPLWYDDNNMEAVSGRKFLEVTIGKVEPGNSVFPLKVNFTTADGSKACVLMSVGTTTVQNRTFNDLFSTSDIRKRYPTINDDKWAMIVKGSVANEMTKDECRLSLGAPKRIDTVPTYGGLQEFWYYEDGTYLRFLDGILQQYRR